MPRSNYLVKLVVNFLELIWNFCYTLGQSNRMNEDGNRQQRKKILEIYCDFYAPFGFIVPIFWKYLFYQRSHFATASNTHVYKKLPRLLNDPLVVCTLARVALIIAETTSSFLSCNASLSVMISQHKLHSTSCNVAFTLATLDNKKTFLSNNKTRLKKDEINEVFAESI